MRDAINLSRRVSCECPHLRYDFSMPRKPERTETIKVRVTPEQKTSIILAAQSQNISMSAYVAGTATPDLKKKTS